MAAQEGLPGGSVNLWCHSSLRCQPGIPAARAGVRLPHPQQETFRPSFPASRPRSVGWRGAALRDRGSLLTALEDGARPQPGFGEGVLLGVFSLFWLLLFFPPPQGEGKKGGSWGRSSQSRELFGSSVI